MMKKMQTFRLVLAAISVTAFNAHAQSFCEYQLTELKKSHLLAKYEQMPEEQKSNFFATLSTEQRAYILGADLGVALGKAINQNYSETYSDKFNREFEEFKKKCGFMLQ
jgi:hypothetical protein